MFTFKFVELLVFISVLSVNAESVSPPPALQNSSKFKIYPTPCVNNTDCPAFSECFILRRRRPSYCKCVDGTSYDSEANECRRNFRTACDLNGRSPPDCETRFVCLENAKGSQCNCKAGSSWEENIKRCIPIECRERSDCPAWMECRNHQCECTRYKDEEQRYNPKGCVQNPNPSKFYNIPRRCKNNMDCPLFSKCEGGIHSRSNCTCIKDTSYDSAVDECRRNIYTACALNGTSPPDCQTTFLCLENAKGFQCSCKKGRTWEESVERCIPIDCKNDGECPALMTCAKTKQCHCKIKERTEKRYDPKACVGGVGDLCNLPDSSDEDTTLPKCFSEYFCVARSKDPPGKGICREHPDRRSTLMSVLFALIFVEVVALVAFLIVIAINWY